MTGDAPQFGDVLGARVREKVGQRGCYLPTLEAVAFLRAVGMEPTPGRVLVVKLGVELGVLMGIEALQRGTEALCGPSPGRVQ